MSRPGEQRALWRRRAVALAAVLGVVLAALVAIAANGDEEDGYLVRAVFDNASFVIPGEDVKIAGVVVGQIHDVDLTEDNRAAVVLSIEDPAFVPFRRDARCEIGLQSLIGEQFIECDPTRPTGEGEEPAAPRGEIASGRGEGQHLLPVTNTVTPVGEDLLRNINRLPQREGLRLLINEFGAGMAANGDRLRAAVRRANPALKELDIFIRTLADQNQLLGRLIDESDTVLAQWAERRVETAEFIDRAGATAAAAAERGDDIERNFERFPPFLRELTPTAESFTGLADQMVPALDTLADSAPEINEAVERLGPFTAAAQPALISLGDFADRGRELFPAFRPLVRDLGRLGKPLRPASDDLAKLFGSFDDTGGIEELMKLIYFYTGTVNGVDDMGHYVRSALTINGPCLQRQPTSSTCESTLSLFGDPVKGAANLASRPRTVDQLKDDFPGDTALGYDLDSEEAEPLLEYLLGSPGAGR